MYTVAKAERNAVSRPIFRSMGVAIAGAHAVGTDAAPSTTNNFWGLNLSGKLQVHPPSPKARVHPRGGREVTFIW